MGVDGALVALEVVAENLLHELHAGVHAAGVAGEGGEELELGGREVDLLALHHHLVAGDVDDQVPEVQDLDLGLGFHAGAAQQGADAGHELAGRERLDEVVVGAELEADDAVLDLTLGGEHDDGHVGGVADGAANALAGQLGEHEVEDDEVEGVLLELLHGRLAVAHGAHPVTLALQVRLHGVADYLLVLNQQNALGV